MTLKLASKSYFLSLSLEFVDSKESFVVFLTDGEGLGAALTFEVEIELIIQIWGQIQLLFFANFAK